MILSSCPRAPGWIGVGKNFSQISTLYPYPMKFWKRRSLGDGFYSAKNMGLCMICCRSPFELKVMTVMPTVELRVSCILVH